MVRSARAGPSNTQQSQRPTQTQRTRGGRRQAEPVSEEDEPEQVEDADEDDGDEMEVDGNSVCIVSFYTMAIVLKSTSCRRLRKK